MLTDINAIAYECGKDSEDWFPSTSDNAMFMILAACGEVGELANLQKKIERGTHAPDDLSGKMVEEAMDAIIYLFCYLDLEGQNVAALYERIRTANVGRFGVQAATCEGGC
jgi:NTP pyrophosphatase (non-canonical NTP hydrolase)